MGFCMCCCYYVYLKGLLLSDWSYLMTPVCARVGGEGGSTVRCISLSPPVQFQPLLAWCTQVAFSDERLKNENGH